MLKLLRKMKPRQWCLIGLSLTLILGQIFFDLTMPEYMSQLTILVQTPGSTAGEIWSVGLQMLGCALASLVLTVICGYFVAQVAAGFSQTLRNELFDKIAGFGKEEMDRFSVPSLIVRTTEDVRQVQLLFAMGLQILVKAPIMAAWAVVKIVGKSWELSVVTAGFVVALLAMMVIVLIVLLPRFKRVQKLMDQMNTIARENLSGISVVHAFNAEDYQNEKFRRANDELTKTQMFNQHTFALLLPAMTLGMSALGLVIFWLGAYLIEDIPGTAARLALFGDIMVFSNYAGFVMMALMMIVMIFMFIPAAQVSANRIQEVLDTTITIRSGEKTQGKEVGTIEFRDVSFRYPGAAADTLSHISFRAERGQTIAFIGATGCGKTTLVDLAARIYDVTQGTVLLDGEDIRSYRFDALYDKLGYVMQKANLFSGSVEDNVNFGQSSAIKSQEHTWEALTLAKASDFVEDMPGQLSHRIARGGGNVSGGQKQRLSIARALARNPEILIFDDSFSALDYKTDAELQAGLERELKGTTKLIVGQRIGTIRNADKILVLDHGTIVGQGRHEELLKTCPVYQQIARSQLSPEELGEGGGCNG